jgi:hypothetical protein
MKKLLKNALSSFHSRPEARAKSEPMPYFRQDFSDADWALMASVGPFTMTGPERVRHLARSVEYVVRNNLSGAFVECGVWRGGSMMCVAYTLLELGVTDRDLYLFDTYEGMPPPDSVDKLYDGTPASAVLATSAPDSLYWARAGLDDVRANLKRTGYPERHLHFVQGKVETTLPNEAPDKIALLRLDTDWYTSTLHELEHLYPRLCSNGVLIIDDYGWWQGARQAVDEYLNRLDFTPLLNRIDETGRSCTKP